MKNRRAISNPELHHHISKSKNLRYDKGGQDPTLGGLCPFGIYKVGDGWAMPNFKKI